jgi:RHS repeat-associated protein
LETDSYYPFGLTQKGISGQAAGKLDNKMKFNNKELQEKEFADGSDLDWYDFDARMYDAQVSRFTTQDPKAEKFYNDAPYVFVSNSPVLHNDPSGQEKIVVMGGADLHNKNRLNFEQASKIELLNFLKQTKDTKEKVGWVVLKKDYNKSEIKRMKDFAKITI